MQDEHKFAIRRDAVRVGFVDVNLFVRVAVAAIVYVGVLQHESGCIDFDERTDVNNRTSRVEHDLVGDKNFVRFHGHEVSASPAGGPAVEVVLA